MNKSLIFGIILALVFSMTAASALELKDTSVSYTSYREVVAGEAGVVFKIKLENTGDTTKTYEVIPNTNVVKSVGIYRIDPSSTIKLKPGQEETLSFYLALEKEAPSRLVIPLEITSGDESTTLSLVARSIGPFSNANSTAGDFFKELLKIAFFTLLVVIFIVLIIALFRRTRKKEKEKKDDEAPEVETYY